MEISVFDLFKVGIGASSSHTVGSMKAARRFVTGLHEDGLLPRTGSVRAELFGSLGATGHGHGSGSGKAVLLGLEGEDPETVDTDTVDDRVHRFHEAGRLRLLGRRGVAFREREHLVLHRRRTLPFHPNGMVFTARDHDDREVRARTYYSVGGGFVVDGSATGADRIKPDDTPVPLPFGSASELLLRAYETKLPISRVVLANELSRRSESEVRAGLLRIWRVMQECAERGGCSRTETTLPGRLQVPRRARSCCAASPRNPRMWIRCTSWTGSTSSRWPSTRRTPRAVAWSPRPPTVRPGSCPRYCTTTRASFPGPTRTGSPLSARRRRGGGAVQGERVDLRGRGGLPGRGRVRLFHGRRWSRRGARRHAGAGRERHGDRHGAQSRAALRPGRRLGPDPLHRAERPGLRQGDQRGADGAARRRHACASRSTRSSRRCARPVPT